MLPADCGGVKKALAMEAQVSGDVLDVVCINGGPITQVEQEEMPSLLADARACTYSYLLL